MDILSRTTDFSLTNAVAVLPDCVIEGATIVVRDGLIVEIGSGRTAVDHDAIDCAGSFCMPGAVDSHSDGLEKELRPRPGVILPMDFAMRSFEGRVRAAGVTTVFHGVGFDDSAKYDRSVAQAHAMCDAVASRASSGSALVDHRILYRLDVRDAAGLAALQGRVDAALPDDAPAPADDASSPLVSYEDHTPGRGQYSDRRWFERYIAGTKGLDADEAARYIDRMVDERDARLGQRDVAVPWLAARAHEGAIRLMCHDPAELVEVDEAVASGAVIAEFPTTVAAAAAAREYGLSTVCGAPNAMRGESHSGNVSARDLIASGLCDGLASDYLPSTLLGAAATLVGGGACDLPAAIRLITAGPAAVVGLHDRGRLAPGLRGDVVVFELDGALPTVRLTISQASTGRGARAGSHDSPRLLRSSS